MRCVVWLVFLPGFLCNRNILSISQKNFFTWNGSCVMIPCTIRHNNPPLIPSTISLLWYFNPSYKETLKDYEGTLLYHSNNSRDSVITTSPDFQGRVTFVGDLKRNCSVKISQLQKNDSGPYGARLYAQTERPSKTRPSIYEKWYQSTQITIIEPPPAPKLVTIPWEIRESQGSTTDVSCSVNYHCPDEPITLTLSGLEETRWFSPSTSSRNGVIETKARFIPTWEDHGKTLRCLLHSHDGSEISQGNVLLDVKHSPKGVMIKATPRTTVQEGEKLSLECVVNSSNPEPTTYTWYKDGQPTNNYGKKINIDFVEEQHSGRYRCDVNNGYGLEKAEETTINVQYGPKDTQFRKSTDDITEGRDVVLQCSSRGNPAVTYACYRRSQSGILVNMSELHLLKIQPSDSGTYYCTAQNDLGNSTSSDAILDVYYRRHRCRSGRAGNAVGPVGKESNLPKEEEEVEESHRKPNRGRKASEAQEEGKRHAEEPRMRCVVWLVFLPEETRWFSPSTSSRNGVIETKARFIPTWEDHGKTLRCLLHSHDGSEISQGNVLLDVKHSPKGVMIKATPGRTVREGEKLSLECVVNSSNPDPTSYTWYKDGHWRNNDGNMINIDSVEEKHSGVYKCEVGNGYGSQTTEETIDVQYGPKDTHFSKSTEEITEGRDVVLQCSSRGNPAVTYAWYKKNQSGILVNKSKLHLLKIQPSDSGTYYCTAQNDLGNSTSDAILDVFYGPKNVQLTVDAPDHRPIKERDTIILNCSVGSCNPGVTRYRWFKSTNEIKNRDQPILQIHAEAEQATSYTCDACNRVNCGRSNPVAVNVHFVPKDVNVVQKPTGPIREGNRVELRCEVGMATPPGVTYMWYKKGKRVDCATAVWPIPAVGPADRGTYSCEANNSIGTSERSTIMLDVQYGPHNVSLSLNNQDVITEGMKVVLVCTCAAYPSAYTYRWYRNDEQYTQGTSDILILQRVQVQDSGTYRCIAKNTISTGNSQPLHLIVSYSKATVLKRTIIGLGILFSVLIVLGFVVVVLRRWKKNPGTGSMQRSGSFFVRKPKAERLCNNNNRPNETRAENVFGFLNQSAEVSVSYAAIRVPPSSSEGRTEYARVKPQRIALAPSDESAVYSVITKPGLPAKGDTKHDYENVEKNNEEELHYSSLVNLAPRPHLTFPDSETDSESEESIQYASLKH
ncbi:B-cell receptor CD22-like [Hemicordylus capensis]|uniref:B-cell receptor CD22-like n=1 Tax=Hemicordylus capensis TaxID=884348 RepID=UPI0023047AF5|nr:B-cell receptor CD22-like [Hemicordylus capensis]